MLNHNVLNVTMHFLYKTMHSHHSNPIELLYISN